MEQHYSYQTAVAASESIRWHVEEIIGGDKRLDFTKPFMPESLARVEGLTFLTPYEQRTLNQIRGNAYLCFFGLVEEFILPFVVAQAMPQSASERDDGYRVRALLQFAEEEAKHIQLFKCFREDIAHGFGLPCQVIGPAKEIARAVLDHDALAVALLCLHIEWMTQRHFVESIKDDRQLCAQFKSMLKHHWMEEVQHARLDVLMIEAMAKERTPQETESAVEEYLAIVRQLDHLLLKQVEFDLITLMHATRRSLNESRKSEFRAVQQQANRWTYLGSGMTHENVLATLETISPEGRARVEKAARDFC
jgi:hypothetical protein